MRYVRTIGVAVVAMVGAAQAEDGFTAIHMDNQKMGSAVSAYWRSQAVNGAGSLHDAARSGDVDLVNELVADGADINERDATGETPLLAAALAGQTAIVELLLSAEADPTVRNDRGMLPLHAAAFAGDLSAVTVLLENDLSTTLNDHENKFGVTPLIVAAEEDHGEVVTLLTAKGADLEIAKRHGYTALTRASYKANEDIITLLMKSGAQCQEIDPAWLENCSKRKAAMGL